MYKQYIQFCLKLQNSGKYRKLPAVISSINKITSPSVLDFSSNDYLGFSKLQTIAQAAAKACEEFGTGSTGSRLLSGNNILFEELESSIAISKNTEAALIFNSGFQANLTSLASLLDQSVLGLRPIVFFDRLNHSSLYQAVFLSNAELVRYQHCDMQQLSDLLEQYKNDNRPKFIVTETIFGMDGDVVPLEDIAELAKQHNALLYLDEAHATGVIGKNGYGLSTTLDLSGLPHVIMGTFSKALGVFGAYIACSQTVKDYLINKSAGFIYSTALPPMVIGAATKAWQLLPSLEQERQALMAKAENLRTSLKKLGFDTAGSSTHIIPIILGQDDKAVAAKNTLLEHNIVVSAVRSPTVPPNTARLRIALTTSHSQQDVDKLLAALESLLI